MSTVGEEGRAPPADFAEPKSLSPPFWLLWMMPWVLGQSLALGNSWRAYSQSVVLSPVSNNCCSKILSKEDHRTGIIWARKCCQDRQGYCHVWDAFRSLRIAQGDEGLSFQTFLSVTRFQCYEHHPQALMAMVYFFPETHVPWYQNCLHFCLSKWTVNFFVPQPLT